jgi:hypothetical protein
MAISLQEEAQRVYEEEERRRRQDVESTANLARQIGERKAEKRRRRTLSNATDVMYSQDYEQVLEPGNIHKFNSEIKCLNFQFTSVSLSNARPGAQTSISINWFSQILQKALGRPIVRILIVTTRRVWNSLSLKFTEYSSIINITRTLMVIFYFCF